MCLNVTLYQKKLLKVEICFDTENNSWHIKESVAEETLIQQVKPRIRLY